MKVNIFQQDSHIGYKKKIDNLEKDLLLDKHEERRGGVRTDMGVIGELGYVGLA